MRPCSSLALMLALSTAIAGRGPHARAATGLTLDPPPDHAPAALGSARDSMATDPASAFERGGNTLWAVPLRDLSATLDRPIFSASRRPPAPPPAVPAALPPKPVVAMPQVADRPPLVLIGTIIGESLQIGIFLEETTKKIARLAIGEDHGGWILRSVGTGEARFESAYRIATLELRPPAQGAGTGNPALAIGEPIIPIRHRKR
jgi:hypothetical protein